MDPFCWSLAVSLTKVKHKSADSIREKGVIDGGVVNVTRGGITLDFACGATKWQSYKT